MKELKENIRQIVEYDSNDKELEQITREMQKTVLKTVLSDCICPI